MLNLFSLMIKASIPDIALEPDKAVKKLLEKLRLELSEEEAVQYIQGLIDSSASAVMPAIVEQFHKFTQLMRKWICVVADLGDKTEFLYGFMVRREKMRV